MSANEANGAEEAVSGRGNAFVEKLGIGAILTVLGSAVVYFSVGWVGTLVNNHSARLKTPQDVEGNKVTYDERLPVTGFWKYFLFVDKDGMAVTTITTPEGGLVARLTDNDNNGSIGRGDVVEVVENVNGIRGTLTYHEDKVVDSDGKTEFKQPATVLQARIIEHGRQERAKWDSWLRTHQPEIKAKLQQQYQQQRK